MLRTFFRFLVRFVSTAGGAGYLPKAPGTAGSLVALPLLWVTREWDAGIQIVFWIALFFMGLWACREWQRLPGARRGGDDQRIVIDEVLGMGVALAGLTSGMAADVRLFQTLAAGFLLFRLFDIWKPWPIRAVDRWSKNKTGWTGAFGVIADDLAAGVAARVVLEIFERAQT